LSTNISPNRAKKNAKKATELEQDRLITRIRNRFELEGWSTERIAEAIALNRSEVIRIIQTSQIAK
jgi:ribosome-binding protein aMBF1 (putative translation factor)